MKNSSIEWTDHTLNFWWGCTKVSPACTHCYAESVAKVFGKRLFGTVPQWGAGKPRYERLAAARKEALAMQKKAVKQEHEASVMKANGLHLQFPDRHADLARRPRVFVNSMSDWLDAEVPLEWLAFLLETIHLCPNLDFQLLTKRPENWKQRVLRCREHLPVGSPPSLMITHWAGFILHGATPPPNVWIGTTVENQEQADKRIPRLLEIPARVRFLSCEPLLGPVDFSNVDGEIAVQMARNNPRVIGYPADFIHWVIAGGESGGPARPMHPDWLRSLRDQCAAAQVPFFFKQWGEWISVDNIRHCTSEAARLDKGYRGHKFPDGTLMLRIGDKHTSNNLDGQQHLNFPA